MNKFFLTIVSLFPFVLSAYSEELLLENEEVCVVKWKLLPGERVGQHCDENASVIIPLQGGILKRLGEDGSTMDIILPTGQAIFQEPDLEVHDAMNISNAPIEAIMIELKK